MSIRILNNQMRMTLTATAIVILTCFSLSGFAAEKSVAQTDNNRGENAAIDDGELGKDYFQKAILLFRDNALLDWHLPPS